MKKIDLLISVKHMYTMEGEGVGYKNNWAVAVDSGKIIACGPAEALKKDYLAEEAMEEDGKVLLPGFIDGHMHTGHGVLRGVAQDISNWMMEGVAPFDLARSSEAKTSGSRLAIAEAVCNGTTTIGDDGTDMEGALAFIKQIGVRGNVSVRIREAVNRVYAAGELYEYSEEMGRKSLQECLDLYERYHNADGGRIKIRFGPQGPDFVSKEMLEKIKILARERNTKIHMHLQQGSRETKQMLMRYKKRSIPWLDEMGYLNEDLIGIHLTDALDEEVALAARKGVSMILCSSSIGVIDGLVPPAKVFQDNGGKVGLGSDQAPGNNCHNMINEMKLTAILNKVKYEDPEEMPAWKVLRMATIENAQALGIDESVGSIREGKDADLIMIDLCQMSLAPLYTLPMRNFVPNLVYSARGHEVDTVIVQGKVLVKDKKPVTFNVGEILGEVQDYADGIGAGAEAEFHRINGKNALYMREDKL